MSRTYEMRVELPACVEARWRVLADARGMTPEDMTVEAVRRYLERVAEQPADGPSKE